MTMTLPLGLINTLAADTIERVGWTQHEEFSETGAACLTGALKLCSPQPGDWLIARAVYRHYRHAEAWNDDQNRTEKEVIAYLRNTKITDKNLAATFGTEWETLVAFLRRSASLTVEEIHQLSYTWTDEWDDAWSTVYRATRFAELSAVATLVGNAAWDTVEQESGNTHITVEGAARALLVRHLIGQYGFTQGHYGILTDLWNKTIGPAHPADSISK